MDLFNKYKNKDFNYITNIINKINKYNEIVTEKELKKYFNETCTFKEMKESICNSEDIYKIFTVQDDESIKPVYKNIINIRPSYPEKAWLYSIISDPKAKLFLDDEQINFLKKALENTNNLPYPLSNNDVYICRLNNQTHNDYTPKQRKFFKMIIQAIKEQKYIILTNNADDGNIYKDSKLIPYKIEYNNKQDTFSITCYNDVNNEIIRIFFTNIDKLEIGEIIQNYFKIKTRIRQELEKKRTTEPVIIQINDENNALQRSAYIFAHYERMIYKENDNIYMKIFYYKEYQQEDILRGILQLGRFVKLIAPDSLVDKIKEIIMKKSEIYK